MSGVNVLIFTDHPHSRLNENMNVYLRGAGAYRIATEIRNAGYTCQVVDFFSILDYEFIEKIIDKYVGKDTLVVGFGNTFFEKSDDDGFLKNVDIDTFIKNRTNIRRGVPLSKPNITPPHTKTNIFPFSEDLIKRHLIDKAKSRNKNVKIVLAGPNIFNQPTTLIDCCIAGFSDLSILDYLKSIKSNNITKRFYNENDNSNFNFNFSKINWEKNDNIFHNEVLPIEISRGCIFDCKFCSFHLRGKSKFDYIKDPEILKEEFIRNYELYGTTHYSFAEDTFNDSTHKLELLLNKVVSQLPFKLRFGAFLRLDLIHAHREQIDLLKELGIKTSIFGIESINPASLKIIGKTLTLDKVETITHILKEKWNNHATIMGSFIYGLPGDNKESLKTYENWILTNSLDYFNGIFFIPFQMNKYGQSFIAKNFESYGYTFTDNQNFWTNTESGLTFLDAVKTTHEVQKTLINDNRYRFSGHLSLASINFGISDDDVFNTSLKDINISNTTIKYKEYLNLYKEKLLND